MTLPTRANDNSEVLAEATEFGTDTTFGSGTNVDTKIGDLTEAGVRFAVNVNEVEIRSGSQREVYAYIRGSVSQLWSGELLNVNVNNYAFAFGITENTTNITGAGSSGDPYILDIDPALFGQQVERVYYATGLRVDGDVFRAESNARVFAPNVEWTLAQGEATAIPFALRVNGAWEISHHTP